MKSIFKIFGLSAFVTCSLLSCSDSGGEKALADFQSEFGTSLVAADSLAGAKVPVLRSSVYDAKWGDPKIGVSSQGDYELSYANPSQPFDRLVIYGSVRPFPKLGKAPGVSGEKMIEGVLTGVTSAQNFRTVMIQGQPVRWFQESTSGGADGAYYSTEGFSLKDASGKTGYYRMVVESGDHADVEVKRRFASGGF